MTATYAPAEPGPPTRALWIGFMAMVFGNFMSILDVQIVASALTDIQAGVSATRDEISWVQTSYLIAEVIGLPLSGFLARALGVRLLFSLSAILFGAASLACAFAWDMTSLITFRAIQGFVGAAMIPTTMSTVYVAFPQNYWMRVSPLIGLVSTMAPSIGPTLGGYVAEHLGWRALFWINVIPSILIATVVWNNIRIGAFNAAILRRIDFIGLIGLALFLGCAQYVLEEGPGASWFADSEIIFYACLSAIGAVVFFRRALTQTLPIVDLKPFTVPTFAIGSAIAFLLGVGLYAPIFLQPVFLGSVQGLTAQQIGNIMFVQGMTMFAMAPLMGRLRVMDDLRPLGFAGLLAIALSCWLQAHLTAESGFWEFALPQMLRGAGMMSSFTAVMQPTIASLPPSLVQVGTPLFNLMRNLGGAFGIAMLATVQAHSYLLHRQELYTAADPNNPGVRAMIDGMTARNEAIGLAQPDRVAEAAYARILDREALVMTFNDQFLTIALLLAFAAFAIWFLRTPPRLGLPAEPAAQRSPAHG
ncbi:MAG: DHA2 family efflux MFS transporter permease subunit [Alphaproteobacteria bacterium]|nr:DHA2 family efflux MFS transporter permease subunit [Alphaproteobacteria bacterium]